MNTFEYFLMKQIIRSQISDDQKFFYTTPVVLICCCILFLTASIVCGLLNFDTISIVACIIGLATGIGYEIFKGMGVDSEYEKKKSLLKKIGKTTSYEEARKILN